MTNNENYDVNNKAINKLTSHIKRLYLTVVPLAIIFAICTVVTHLIIGDASYSIAVSATLLAMCCASTISFMGLKIGFVLKFKKEFKTENHKALKNFLWKAAFSRFFIPNSWCEKLMLEA